MSSRQKMFPKIRIRILNLYLIRKVFRIIHLIFELLNILLKLPPYKVFPIIASQNISLRSVLDSDIKDLVSISFYDGIEANSENEANMMQSKINKDYSNGESIHWCVVDNTTTKVVGTCGYYRGFNKGEGELGCILLPEYVGLGYMTKALSLAIEFGRNTIELNRIWASTSKQNKNAIALLKRLDFIASPENKCEEIEFEIILKRNQLSA